MDYDRIKHPKDRLARLEIECAAYYLLHKGVIREYQKAMNTDSDPGVEAAAEQMRLEIERLRMALNTVGTAIYTGGRGTKLEQELLSFIRKELGKE